MRGPDGRPGLLYQVYLASARGDEATLDSILDLADAQDAVADSYLTAHLVLDLYDLESAWRALSIVRRVSEPTRHWGTSFLEARMQLACGSWSRARPRLDELEERLPAGRFFHAVAASLPHLPVPPEELRAVREDVERWDGTVAHTTWPDVARRLVPHLRLYYLGLLSSKLGEFDRAAGYARELERLAAPPEAGSTARDLALTIRADALWRQDRPGEALSTLEPVRAGVPLMLAPRVNAFESLFFLHTFSHEHARFLRAAALEGVGRDDEAGAWWRYGFEETPGELMYRGVVDLHLAELHLRQGRVDEAREAFAHAATLWSDADPALRRRLESVGRRLAAEPAAS